MTWFDWLFVIALGIICIVSVICWIYTIVSLFRIKKL